MTKTPESVEEKEDEQAQPRGVPLARKILTSWQAMTGSGSCTGVAHGKIRKPLQKGPTVAAGQPAGMLARTWCSRLRVAGCEHET